MVTALQTKMLIATTTAASTAAIHASARRSRLWLAGIKGTCSQPGISWSG
jgi:hypothetical protein